jgi:hypothetical protein
MSRSGHKDSRALAGAAILSLLVLAGCKEQVTTLDDVASVRVVHNSPDIPAFDAYLEGITIPLASNLAYGEAGDFGLVPAVKGVILELRAVGSDPRSEPLFMSLGLTLGPSEINTATVAGLGNSDDATDSLRVLLDLENFDEVAGGTWRARFSHVVSNADEVDIDIDDNGSIEETLDRFETSHPEGFVLPADQSIPITLVVEGEPVLKFTLPPLPEGPEYFVYITGLAGAPVGDPAEVRLLLMNQESLTLFVQRD